MALQELLACIVEVAAVHDYAPDADTHADQKNNQDDVAGVSKVVLSRWG